MSSRFLLLVTSILPLLLFGDITSANFSQDDFFHLRAIMDKEYASIPSFFLSLQKEYAFYRPLSRETFNLLMYKNFGLNPFPFHAVNLVLIIANISTIYLIAQKLLKKFIFAFVAALLYAVNSIHSIELYYLASVQTLLATFFLLWSTFFYLVFIKKNSFLNYCLSIICFILGLLSHEISIVFVGVIFSLEIIINRKKIWDKRLAVRLLPFTLIGVFYLINTALLYRLPNQQVYQPVFSVKSMVNTLSWYTLWVVGLSELLIDFIGPKLAVNPNLLRWYGDYLKVVLPIFIFWGISLGCIFITFRKKILGNRIFWLLIFTYLFSLSPFLFFPQHKSSYYLTFASSWFSLLLALLISFAWERQKMMKVWVVFVMLAFVVISYQTLKLNQLTYWAAKRGKAAYYLLSDIKKSNPQVAKGTIFYIKNDPEYPFIAKEWGSSSKQAFYILSGADALKLLYKDPSIKVYFEDMGGLPKDSQPPIISHIAKFPY